MIRGGGEGYLVRVNSVGGCVNLIKARVEDGHTRGGQSSPGQINTNLDTNMSVDLHDGFHRTRSHL